MLQVSSSRNRSPIVRYNAGISSLSRSLSMAANIAPGMERDFTAEDWRHIVDKGRWQDAQEEAEDLVNLEIETDIQGYDIDDHTCCPAPP